MSTTFGSDLIESLTEALEQADSFARVIADNMPGRVVYWDHEMRCRFVNKVFCEWYGPAWRRPPHGIRTTIGTEPPQR